MSPCIYIVLKLTIANVNCCGYNSTSYPGILPNSINKMRGDGIDLLDQWILPNYQLSYRYQS